MNLDNIHADNIHVVAHVCMLLQSSCIILNLANRIYEYSPYTVPLKIVGNTCEEYNTHIGNYTFKFKGTLYNNHDRTPVNRTI